MLSVAHLLTTSDHPFREPFYLASIVERGKLIGCAVAAPPDGIELTELPEGVAAELVPSVAKVRRDLPWVGATRSVQAQRSACCPQTRNPRSRHAFIVRSATGRFANTS